MKISRPEFLALVSRVYRIGNISDHETNPNMDWTKPSMAATVCRPLDDMLHNLVKTGVINDEEAKNFYDTLL
jgi:hypothetical protein